MTYRVTGPVGSHLQAPELQTWCPRGDLNSRRAGRFT